MFGMRFWPTSQNSNLSKILKDPWLIHLPLAITSANTHHPVVAITSATGQQHQPNYASTVVITSTTKTYIGNNISLKVVNMEIPSAMVAITSATHDLNVVSHHLTQDGNNICH